MAQRMSDAAVQAKTGKTWDEWFGLLDAAGAGRMSHREIVAWISREHAVGSWWEQMVTVTYEQARGRRERHQTADGFQASASRTLKAPAGRLFEAWSDEATRRRWLPDADLKIRKATPDRSLRITWQDGTNLDVNLFPKGEDRCQISLEQRKLADADAVARAKAYWKQALDRLRGVLEG